ncbi:hypothetical protein COT66_00795 [Candidatus Shapirobacteria bacterium CG09_land_8_20_14_0_10_49_15]|uniref:Type II secretion system protein GspF domain-containing protein n=2 Tax=Candidatus Shapironibacteriota TaxID=1752721 RepID=A0A2M8L6K8_9BACT|nr:MAG: hypothetical protein COT66_00795 [Candidatus Shapirobacteria bacterium CG09_land_8_20_14_0_10_49_15]PJE69861.1 MAG: hypothetical protein COU97_02665 [Candidatus Shapirobacteria bacterium CG10_big_fil_rev_8_21_14_0_10_48_15]
MEKFQYVVKNKNGETQKGLVEARSEKQAVDVLREKGLWVISVALKRESFSAEFKTSLLSRITATDKVNFTRQLATMINSGLPITDALTLLEAQSNPAMGQVVSAIVREVEAGGTLVEAMQKRPDIFNRIYLALVRAGEAAGVLDKVLLRLADNLEKEKEFGSRIKGAMIYPAVVVVGMIAVMAIMVIFVIPQMRSIYDQFQTELPFSTKALLAISDFMVKFWPLVLASLAGGVAALRVAARKPKFKDLLDGMLFKLPIIGKLRKTIILTEFARTLGLLVGAGILIVEAMEIVYDSLGSSIFAKAVKSASEDVKKGLSLAASLARTEVFPPLLPQMIAVGEETGKISEVLKKISTYFEMEADNAVKNLTTALEPLIMIVLGVGVAFLIMAIIMPIYQLTSSF